MKLEKTVSQKKSYIDELKEKYATMKSKVDDDNESKVNIKCLFTRLLYVCNSIMSVFRTSKIRTLSFEQFFNDMVSYNRISSSPMPASSVIKSIA